ncbi:MAG: LysM peptidoglycan-binding domain-containing protein [Chloroflexi bacterium]|nr:LysM peptidoglycan-binding domain-containing protein [Chloroflexota bacterium]
MIYRLLALLVGASLLLLPAAAQDVPPGVTIHVVQRGENLFRIALQYGLTVDELARLNGIADPGNIQVGQRLLVPSDAALLPTSQPLLHVVQPGETLRSIAELYGMTVDDLAARNQITDVNTVYVGQVLNIAAAPVVPTAVAAAPTEPPASVIHVVQPGETLFRIATGYGLTVNELAQANSISDPTVIYAGQQLVIPNVTLPQLALDLPPIVTGLDIRPLLFLEGQTGRIHLTTAQAVQVSGAFLGRSVNVAADASSMAFTILIGIPMFTDAGVYPLLLSLTDSAGQVTPISVNLQVLAGNYGSETINLLADRSGLLDPSVESAEQQLIQNVMGSFTPTRFFVGPMGLPAAAAMTSPYGRKRSYNGGPFDRFHSGTDFAGAPGAPVLAAAPGYVVLADHLNVRGNATIIDHGWGVFTGYWHQTDIYVHVGDFVTTGQVIGTVGATGRVTGAHLHWELWVNGVPVDPMQWVSQSFG